MDIFGRLDRLEDFVANSKRVPLSSSVMLNEAEFYDLLDDIRARRRGYWATPSGRKRKPSPRRSGTRTTWSRRQRS